MSQDVVISYVQSVCDDPFFKSNNNDVGWPHPGLATPQAELRQSKRRSPAWTEGGSPALARVART